MVVKGIVLTGFGINCDYETQFALKMANCEARRVHVNDFISGRESLDSANILVFPGGFSFGDDIASGKVLANKIKRIWVRKCRSSWKKAGWCWGFAMVFRQW